MDSNVIGMCSTGITTSADRFFPLSDSGSSVNTAVSTAQTVMPCSGTLSNLYAGTDTAPGAGITRTIAVYKNGVQQSLAVAMNNTTSGTDTSNTVSFSAGDILAIITNATATTASTGSIRWSLKMTCAANTSALFAHSQSGLATGATGYIVAQGTGLDTVTDQAQLCPTAGTLKNAYISMNASPGAGKSYAYTLVKNGVDTGITATISDTNTTANDTTHTVSVSATDTLYWKVVPSGTPTARQVGLSLEFDPTTNGESVQMFGTSQTPSNVGVRFNTWHGTALSYNATEAQKTTYTQACVWKNLYTTLSAAPGTGKSYTVQLSVNGTPGNPSVLVSDAATSGNDTTNTFTTSFGDLPVLRTGPSGSPTASTIFRAGIVNYIAPAADSTTKNLAALGVG